MAANFCFKEMANKEICSTYGLKGNSCKDDLPGETSIDDLSDDCLSIIINSLENWADREAFGLTCHRWLKIQSGVRRSLRFQFNENATQNCIKYLSKLLHRFTALQSISLAGCTRIPDVALTAFQSAGLNLQRLSLDCCFSITDEGISHICHGCTALVSLSLYRCKISDMGLEYIARNCSNLSTVNLSYCPGISDSGIAGLGKGCPGLRVVNISYCRNIQGDGFNKYLSLQYLEADSCRLTDAGLSEAVEGGSLQYINLSHSQSRSGFELRGFSYIGISCPNLEFLHLRMCRGLDDSAVIEISRGCPLLKDWNLAVCPQVTVAGWEAVALNCKKLEILHVNRNRYFCDRSLLFLKSGCPKLSFLYLNGCPKLKPITVELFKQARSFVRIISAECMIPGPVDKFLQE